MASAPPPRPHSLQLLDKLSTTGVDYLTLACYGVFSILIGFDVWRAFRKRATWLPGKAFVLSGVTVQIIAWWTGFPKISEIGNLIYNHQLFVSARVAVCVFIGYLLPGMAAPSLRTSVVLAITIGGQTVSELILLFNGRHNIHTLQDKYNWVNLNLSSITWSTIVNLILFICIIVLCSILGCTILASKTIRGLLRQRISAIYSIIEEGRTEEGSTKEGRTEEGSTESNERTRSISWNDFEEEVLGSWLVARVCRVDYVISRSVFSSAVGLVVTVCVIIFLLSNTFRNQYFPPFYPEDIGIVSLLYSFNIIGWVFISWRWLAAQLYFRPYRHSWRRCLCLEDFWTSNTLDLIHMYDLKRDRQRFQEDGISSSKMPRLNKLQSLPTKIFTKVRVHKLLHLVLILQVSVVFFSKLCGFLSQVIVGKFVYWCRKHIRKGDPVATPEKYARILERICMPGEDPSDLWEANLMSFKQVKSLMQKGCEEGRLSEEINSMFSLYSQQWAEDGTQLLNMLKKESIHSVLKHFPSVEKQCVKMTIVSLITICIRLHKSKSEYLKKVLKACHEIWDLLSFVDERDIDLQANKISLLHDFKRDKDQVCMAAEREFYKLQMEYDKVSSDSKNCVISVEEDLQDLLEKCEGLLKEENLLGDSKEEIVANLSDSKDWMKIAPSYTLYKLCKLMLLDKDKQFMAWTEESLRNVIAACVSRLPEMLVKQCWKWAQEFEEDKIWEAIHLVGKCRGMMEAWDLKRELTFKTTKQWTIEVMPSNPIPS